MVFVVLKRVISNRIEHFRQNLLGFYTCNHVYHAVIPVLLVLPAVAARRDKIERSDI